MSVARSSYRWPNRWRFDFCRWTAPAGAATAALEIEAVRLAAPDAVPGRRCKILFIPAGAERRAIEFTQAAAGSAVLILAEGEVLGSDRAQVVLALEEHRPALSISLTAARRAGLDIRSRLSRLARKVS